MNRSRRYCYLSGVQVSRSRASINLVARNGEVVWQLAPRINGMRNVLYHSHSRDRCVERWHVMASIVARGEWVSIAAIEHELLND